MLLVDCLLECIVLLFMWGLEVVKLLLFEDELLLAEIKFDGLRLAKVTFYQVYAEDTGLC